MLDLTNCTFLIPLKIDNNDRIFNLKTVLRYLDSFAKTNVCIMEHNKITTKLDLNFKNLNIIHENKNYDKFYKTKLLNRAVTFSKTEILIPYDCDILIPIKQLQESVNLIQQNKIDYCFPYGNYYVEIPKKIEKERKELLETFDFDNFFNKLYNNQTSISNIEHVGYFIRNTPPGGCIVIKRQVYIDFGLENEEFYGYAPEDQERKIRLEKLNYRTTKIDGNIYHLEHDANYLRISSPHNKKIWSQLKNMNAEGLRKYYKEKNYKGKYNL